MNCYRCMCLITAQNESPEHIIQDSIGGALVSRDILCHDCNLWFGRAVDPAFTRFTSYLYRMVLMARPTSRVSDRLVGVTELNEEVHFGPNMEMDTKVEINLKEGKPIILSAPQKDIEKKVLKILGQLKGKHKDIEPKEMIASAKQGKIKFDKLVYFTNYEPKNSIMGGPAFFRGIKKIAIGFYLSKGHEQRYVQDVINQVKEGKPAPRKISTFYYPLTYQIHNLGEKEISHVIKLVGDPNMGVLYCYIELFNIAHSFILLNRYYYGPPMNEQYCYDVLASVELDKPINLHFDNRELMLGNFNYDWNTNPQAQIAYNRTRKILADLLRAKKLIA